VTKSELKNLIRECINEVSSDTFSKHSKLLSESIGIKLNEAMEWKDIPDEVKNQAYELIQKHNASVSDDGGGMKKGFYIIDVTRSEEHTSAFPTRRSSDLVECK